MRFRPAAFVVPLLAAALLVAAGSPALASSGAVSDPRGNPLAEVVVCYVVAGVEQLCVTTDRSGRWQLPASKVDTVRLSLDGFLPQKISSEDHVEAILLRPAALLLVTLVGAGGDPLESGEFDVLYSSGKQIGPFQITRAAGTRIRSLEPGPILVVGRSDGYLERRQSAELIGGEEAVIQVLLESNRAEHESSAAQ